MFFSDDHRGRPPRALIGLAFVLTLSGAATTARAHHGVAGLGAAGLQGPGAPIEAATSATLPRNTTLLYLKLDHAKFQRFTPAQDNEGDYSQFWMLGVGRGFTPWFSGYVFLPYHVKVDEGPNAFNTRGFADVALFGQVGFTYDNGFKFIPANESLDDQEDWHFTVFGGSSIPSGDPNLRDSGGAIDPGKSTGFGEPSYSLGVTATKMLTARWTANVEVSSLWFKEHQYDDGNRTKFGNEKRLNTGLVYRAYTNLENRTRVDFILEAQYLSLGRDRTNGVNDVATGGSMVYLLPGVRLYKDNYSFAIGIKKPSSTRLNEEDQQQGAEGKEDYRLALSASVLF
jgi:hypothetical protein